MTSNPSPSGARPNAAPLADAGSEPRFRWPIVLVLVVISLPAGFVPFLAREAHREVTETAGPAPASVDRLARAFRHNKASSTYRFMLEMSTSLVILHLALSTWGFVRKRRLLMGVRGAWLGMLCWVAFVVGAGVGLCLYGWSST